jgi:TonB-linked SusC/RagA family outer membrane protein
MKGLNLIGLTAWNTRSNSVQSYTPTWANGSWDVAAHPGVYSSSSYSTLISNNMLIQGLLTYNKEWGIHSIDAMVGASQETYNETTSLQGETNFPNDKTWVFNKNYGSTVNNNDIYYNKNALLSYFGRAQYALMNRYLMTVSLRRDGSSKFGSENRWGFFPSISGAWKINEEPFIKNLRWLGTAKLRLSWGQAGNDRIGSAQFLSNMAALNYPTGTTQVLTNGYVVGNIANPLLGWETTTSYNIGFDIGVLKDRIYLSVDYYQKRTKDLLLQAPVSLITGYSNMMDNVGNVDNKGIEFELNTANIVNNDFSWNTSFNLSLNRNKITSLGSDNSDIRSGQGSTIIQRVGYPINSYFLLDVERTLRAADFEADGKTPKSGIAIYAGQKAGDTKWVDVNKDGKITSADYAVAGNYQPKFEWGFTNTFKYKGFDASVLLQGRVGGKLLSIGSRGWNRATNAPSWNYMSRWLTNAYWSEAEPGDGKTPAFYATVTGNQYDTNWLYDAGYVRVKNITLGYTLPFKANKFISKARIYASCDNVYIWDHYDPGFSPEAATQDNASSDWGAYPQARTFSFGVNITF